MKSGYAINLAQLRKERGLSQRVAAEHLNVSQALLSHYENGVREPRFEFVERACKYYGVSADYLLGFSDNKTSLDDVVQKLGDNEYVRELMLACGKVFTDISRANSELLEPAAQFMSLSLAVIIRMMGESEHCAEPMHDAALKIAEARIAEGIKRPILRRNDEQLERIKETPCKVLAQFRESGAVEE